MQGIALFRYGLLVFVFLLAGCGSTAPVGPSDEKVRLDYEDSLALLARAMRSPMKLQSFKIIERKVLAEDRVKFHLVVSLGKIPEKITLLYQLTEGGLWKVSRTQMGHL
jgi:hypothetical protein